MVVCWKLSNKDVPIVNPGWALIDIQSFSKLIQRFLRFQRYSELYQPTSILTSLVITDSVMNISEHLIQRWTLLASSKPTKTIKTAKKGVFYCWCWKDEKSKNSEWIPIVFFLKNSKNMIFRKSVFTFVSMSDNFYQNKKRLEKY